MKTNIFYIQQILENYTNTLGHKLSLQVDDDDEKEMKIFVDDKLAIVTESQEEVRMFLKGYALAFNFKVPVHIKDKKDFNKCINLIKAISDNLSRSKLNFSSK